MRKSAFFLALLALIVAATALAADTDADKTDKKVKALENRVRALETKSLKDRIQITGEYRFEAHNLSYEFADWYDGMALQNLMVGTMFYHNDNGTGPGALPMNPDGSFNLAGLQSYIYDNYGTYQAYVGNLDFGTTFPAEMQSLMGSMAVAMGMDPATMTPEEWAAVQNGAMGMLMAQPGVSQDGYKVNNDIMYTNRLRLNLAAEVAKNISFHSRLSMYKTWGDATGVQVFNGQSNSFIVDGNTSNVPNSDVLRVERAYFTWNNLFDTPVYLSIGRRPSTDGPPMHLRNDEKRGGSPMGSLIDMQFDGITVGSKVGQLGTMRLCYGLGYESQYGNGVLGENPLKDAQFLGLNWDVYDKDDMFIQTTVARGFDLTDGFNGLVVLPDNPVSGDPVGAPVMMRFSPSANMGDIDLMGALIMRRDGPIDWFASYNYMKSHPENVTTPFGGLFADPFQTPEEQTASMVYVGARFNMNQDKTKIGVEYNHGSEYWFNFTPSQDDIIAPKTNTRGSVWEAYVTHRVARRFIARLGYQLYDYDYSGSGWHLGAPKDLAESPILGYPTYDKASALSLSLTARF